MSQSVSGALPRYGNGVPVALGNPRGALKYIVTWERPKNLGFGKVVVISGVTHIKSINMKPSVIINLTNDVPYVQSEFEPSPASYFRISLELRSWTNRRLKNELNLWSSLTITNTH